MKLLFAIIVFLFLVANSFQQYVLVRFFQSNEPIHEHPWTSFNFSVNAWSSWIVVIINFHVDRGGSSRTIVVLSVTLGKIEVRFWHNNDKHKHVIRYKIFIKLSTVSTQIFVTPPDGSLYRVGGNQNASYFRVLLVPLKYHNSHSFPIEDYEYRHNQDKSYASWLLPVKNHFPLGILKHSDASK